jgi:hypothetical protein
MAEEARGMVGHIVTVGTSLLTNIPPSLAVILAQQPPGRHAAIGDLRDRTADLSEAFENVANAATVERNRNSVLQALAALQPDVEIAFRRQLRTGRRDLRDFLPQELSYLWTWAATNPHEPKSPVRLLCSDTPECRACGWIIAQLLANHTPWSERFTINPDRDVHVAEGVNTDDAGAFQSRGVHNWMREIGALITNLRTTSCSPIFLNVTGGYKGTVPYSTLRGMLEDPGADVRLAYLFEDSPDIIEIPTYPVGVDFIIWHENARRLRLRRDPLARKYFMPDRRVEDLLDGTTGELQPFGHVLQKAYERQYTQEPLQTYAQCIIRRLLPELDGTEAGKLRQVLDNLVSQAGDVIWVGDKLPGMVDHSLRHHHDLLEIAESFLTPILAEQPNFLSARERFVLLAAVLLHDSGHTLDLLELNACAALSELFGDVTVTGVPENIALFLSDVRDYHQFLAGIRLNDPGLARDLSWPGRTGFEEREIPPELHEAVILASLYHRRRSPYVASQAPNWRGQGTLHLTGQFPGALETHAFAGRVADPEGVNVNLMKVVALLRVIDGCDSQAHRAGHAARLDVALNLLEREHGAARIRALLAVDALASMPADFDVTSPGLKLKDQERASRRRHLAAVEAGGAPAQDSRLWLMAAESIDRSAMTHKQLPHYLKHFAVSEVRILPHRAFGPACFRFHVILDVGDEALPEIVQTKLGKGSGAAAITRHQLLDMSIFESEGDRRPLRDVIQEEVSSEYAEVAPYAREKWNLQIDFWWDEQWTLRQNGGDGKPFFPPSS